MWKSASNELHSTSRTKAQRHMYYVCRAGKKRNPACPQRPIACLDLDRSLRERLERMRGALPDAVAIQQLLHSVSYDSVTRCVSVELRDGSRFEYLLPLPVRPVCGNLSRTRSSDEHRT